MPVSDNTRINDLRRRVQADPASITFAALAEEYRRLGKFHEAIETCTDGLKRHPSYLSAHVTLGRALLEVGRFDEAERELQLVLKSAPENLAAIRGLAEIHHRRGDHGYDVAALTALHEQAVASEVQDAAPSAAVTTEVPSPAVPTSAHQPPSAFEPPELADGHFQTGAPQSITEPPVARHEPMAAPPVSCAPALYDPPGTFELPEFSTPATLAAAVPNVADREIEALERFLAAVVDARKAAPAY